MYNSRQLSAVLTKIARDLPAILTTPIIIPGLSAKPKPRRRKRVAKKESESARDQRLEGYVTQGQLTRFAINGQDVEINSETWIIGKLECGSYAKAKLTRNNNGDLLAVGITVLHKS